MWRRSSFSASDGNCVEVRGDLAAVRDSKHPGVVMPVTRWALARLVHVAASGAGRFDHVA
jgi:hypothetical protein